MIINGIDVRRYGATLLTAETKPPKMTANYEMMPKALLPTEYDTDIPLGSMTMTIYFRGKNRATLERTMSSFMQNFRSSCIMEEIRGFKGKYKGFLAGDDYEKTLQMQYKLSSQGVYTSAVKELPIGEATTVCGGDLNTEFSYDVRYVLKDTFNTVTVIDFVSTAVYAMHFLHGGRGVAFGSKATVENAVDFTFDAIFRHGVKFIKSDGSEVTMQQILNKLGL